MSAVKITVKVEKPDYLQKKSKWESEWKRKREHRVHVKRKKTILTSWEKNKSRNMQEIDNNKQLIVLSNVAKSTRQV